LNDGAQRDTKTITLILAIASRLAGNWLAIGQLLRSRNENSGAAVVTVREFLATDALRRLEPWKAGRWPA
jgi:hypothetical protein